MLRVPRSATGGPVWVFRFTSPTGKRREMGLGPVAQSSAEAAGASLREARAAAARARALLRDHVDPIEHEREQREAARREEEAKKAAARAAQVTLIRFARRYHEQHVEPIRSDKHGKQWLASVEGPPTDSRTPEQNAARRLLDALLQRPIDSIAPLDVLDALVPLCRATPETGRRVFQRLGAIFDAAVLEGLRGDNPCAPIKRELFKRAGRQQRGHFAAMPHARLPDFVRRLRAAEGTAARALEFLILTASRTSEALGAEWREIDFAARTWTVSAHRMKARVPHVVYLSDRALEILEAQRELHAGSRYVFPSTRGDDAPLSNMALAMTLRRLGERAITVHGFRATFSTACHELALARSDAIEACLAHREADRVAAAYNRAQFVVERRALLQAWADYCDGEAPASNVLPLARAA